MYEKPSNVFVAASWIAVGAGMTGFLVGLCRADMLVNENGFYAFSFLLAIFGTIAVQKNTRDSQMLILNNLQ